MFRIHSPNPPPLVLYRYTLPPLILIMRGVFLRKAYTVWHHHYGSISQPFIMRAMLTATVTFIDIDSSELFEGAVQSWAC